MGVSQCGGRYAVGMQKQQVLEVVRSLSPERLAESWDRVGLHVSSDRDEVSGILLCLDLTEAVVEEVVQHNAELVIAYHPPIFGGLKELTDRTWKGRALRRLIREDIAVYSPHTALDAVRGGINDWLCEGMAGTQSFHSEPISMTANSRHEYKVVVFVPEEESEAVREVMSQAGAGWIGRYRECSFESPGIGGFRPIEGANPTIGRVGERETVREQRLEMLVPGGRLAEVIDAMRQAHSYEEPAFDVFEEVAIPEMPEQATGAGRLMTLDQALPGQELVDRIKHWLGIDHVMVFGQPNQMAVRQVAVCPGAGGSLFIDQRVQAQAYVTGEMRYHDALDLQERGSMVILTGHAESEKPYLTRYRERLLEHLGDAVSVEVSQI